MKQIIALLNEAGEVLQPFTRSVQPNSLVYDGTRYAPAARETPDPYALAWWFSIQTTVTLLAGAEPITASQLDYLRASFCSGMGSFNDFWLDASRWGRAADLANARLSAIRSSLCHALHALQDPPPNQTHQRRDTTLGSIPFMLKVNTATIAEFTWSSPEGEIIGAGKEISEELGRKPDSTDLNERHPFDVEICRIPGGKTPYSYHSHSAQWEFYHVISGSGAVRHAEGTTPIEAGDAFLFKPNEPHQLINDSVQDLILYVVADNPLAECYYHPDSNEWTVPIPKRTRIRPAAPEPPAGGK